MLIERAIQTVYTKPYTVVKRTIEPPIQLIVLFLVCLFFQCFFFHCNFLALLLYQLSFRAEKCHIATVRRVKLEQCGVNLLILLFFLLWRLKQNLGQS